MHTTPVSLLERLRISHDEGDWRRFVDLYTPLLYFWAKRAGLAPIDAEDLVQDVFEVLLRKLPEFHYQPDLSFRGWLRTVTLNKWRERQRRAARLHQPADHLISEIPAPEPGDLSEVEYRQQLVARAMELIEPEFESKTWRAFQETAIRGRPAVEVGAELSLSRNAVYVARCRVLKRLRSELEGFLE